MIVKDVDHALIWTKCPQLISQIVVFALLFLFCFKPCLVTALVAVLLFVTDTMFYILLMCCMVVARLCLQCFGYWLGDSNGV